MTIAKKELILQAIEQTMLGIQKANISIQNRYYNTDVGYVDRQYINITEDDVLSKPNNWIIINNEGEEFNLLPGGNCENTLLVQIVGFVKASKEEPNLDSLMNNLQQDIIIAMMKDVTLQDTCDFLIPVRIQTVSEMVYPHGGFVITFDITYTFMKTEF
jgi:hypothetical protein